MNSFQLKRRRIVDGIMLKRYKDLYSILKHSNTVKKLVRLGLKTAAVLRLL
jgi:hypothetical protein